MKLYGTILLVCDGRLNVASGGSAQGIVSLTPPAETLSGTDVTLTIEAEGPGGADSNYAVLRLSVLSKVGSDISVHTKCASYK